MTRQASGIRFRGYAGRYVDGTPIGATTKRDGSGRSLFSRAYHPAQEAAVPRPCQGLTERPASIAQDLALFQLD